MLCMLRPCRLGLDVHQHFNSSCLACYTCPGWTSVAAASNQQCDSVHTRHILQGVPSMGHRRRDSAALWSQKAWLGGLGAHPQRS